MSHSLLLLAVQDTAATACPALHSLAPGSLIFSGLSQRGQSLTQGRGGQPMSCRVDDAVLKAPGMTLNQSASYFICLSREKCLARDSKDVLMADHDLCFLLACSG